MKNQVIKTTGVSKQKVVIKRKNKGCFWDSSSCKKGVTYSYRVKFTASLTENSYVFSTGGERDDKQGVAVVYVFGRLRYIMTTKTKAWYVSTAAVSVNFWNKVEVSWSETKGLYVYYNDKLVASTTEFVKREGTITTGTDLVVAGSSDTNVTDDETFASFEISDIDMFEATRDTVVAAALVKEGNCHHYF